MRTRKARIIRRELEAIDVVIADSQGPWTGEPTFRWRFTRGRLGVRGKAKLARLRHWQWLENHGRASALVRIFDRWNAVEVSVRANGDTVPREHAGPILHPAQIRSER